MCYSRVGVELFLNLVWLATSLFLVAGWIWSIHKGHIEFDWTTLVALVVLIVILFPAISMTDDLVAMNVPAEVDHAIRRSEAPLAPVALLGILGMFAAFLLALLKLTLPGVSFRIGTRRFSATLLAGFIRACGVRPPPSAVFAACSQKVSFC